jgi:hypothetical protein
VLVFLSGIVGHGSQDENKLVDFLFERQGYNPLIRPVENQTQRVKVDFGMALVQLISVVGMTVRHSLLSLTTSFFPLFYSSCRGAVGLDPDAT